MLSLDQDQLEVFILIFYICRKQDPKKDSSHVSFSHNKSFIGAAPEGLASYRGIDYLGLGYDMIFGNPHGDPILQIDPGFRAPAAKLEWDEEYLTRDDSYLAPLGGIHIFTLSSFYLFSFFLGYAYPEKSCYEASSADEITSTSDLQASMATGKLFLLSI